MVKKSVRLEAQERFDLLDALELQNGVFDYIGQALGRLMGWGNGLLSDASPEMIQDQGLKARFNSRFAFYVTTDRGEGGMTGEVVVYDPDNDLQTTTTANFGSALSAANTYFDTGGGTGAGDGTIVLEQGHDAAPYIWARPVVSDGVQDARRKWSIALQTETPVTIPTRSVTCVEFAVSENVPAPDLEDGTLQGWAPIFRVTNWSQAANGTPILVPISAFDNYKWHNRSNQEDGDGGVFASDWYNADNYNLSTTRIFSSYPTGNNISGVQSDAPAVSPVYSLLSNIATFEEDAAGNKNFNDRLGYLAQLATNGTIEPGWRQRINPQNAKAWDKPATHASAGVFDQLNAIRVVLKNLLGEGIYDYGTPASAATPFCAPYEGGYDPIESDKWLDIIGPMTAHWSAKPIRSLNALAFENMVMRAELETIKEKIDGLDLGADAAADAIAELQAAGDPFAETPINDAQPLIPALALTYKANYGHSVTHQWYGGPSQSVKNCQFFTENRIATQHTYSHGGVRITLTDATYERLGGGDVAAGKAALLGGQCVIQATPTHFDSSHGFLFPFERVPVGKIDAENDKLTEGVGGVGGRAYEYVVDSYQKYPDGVHRQFANFYQCTLNILIRTNEADGTIGIEVCPVNTVPDIIESASDLRGYPHWGQIVNKVGNRFDMAANAGPADIWNHGESNFFQNEIITLEAGEQIPPSELNTTIGVDEEVAQNRSYIIKTLVGDVTNPDFYQSSIDVESRFSDGARFDTTDNGGYDYNQTGGIFGAKDDLRGFAHTITFLRPDRYFSAPGTVPGVMNSGYYNYTSEHAPTGAHTGRYGVERQFLQAERPSTGARGLHITNRTHGEFAEGGYNEAIGGANGRFMPSFSLILYPASFTGMGTLLNDPSVGSKVAQDVQYNGQPTHTTDFFGPGGIRDKDGEQFPWVGGALNISKKGGRNG